MSTIMRPYTSRLGGNFVAECPKCRIICAYWDDEDLDEHGSLLCFCDDNEGGDT